MYPRMAAEAKRRVLPRSPRCSRWSPRLKDHEERYKALAANIEAGKVYARETEQVWQCRTTAGSSISVSTRRSSARCAHIRQSWFELKSKNY